MKKKKKSPILPQTLAREANHAGVPRLCVPRGFWCRRINGMSRQIAVSWKMALPPLCLTTKEPNGGSNHGHRSHQVKLPVRSPPSLPLLPLLLYVVVCLFVCFLFPSPSPLCSVAPNPDTELPSPSARLRGSDGASGCTGELAGNKQSGEFNSHQSCRRRSALICGKSERTAH